jgi:hypothetical protein
MQRAAIEVATVLAKEKLVLSLAEKMTSFLETVPNESALERKEETPILATCSGASATTSIRCWLAAEYYKEVLQIQTGGANKGINIFLYIVSLIYIFDTKFELAKAMIANSLLVFQSWIQRAHPSGRLLLLHHRVA